VYDLRLCKFDDSIVVCRSELNSKLQDTLEMIDESMDVALSKTCGNFDDTYYSRIQTAYRLLGKTQASLVNCLSVCLLSILLNNMKKNVCQWLVGKSAFLSLMVQV